MRGALYADGEPERQPDGTYKQVRRQRAHFYEDAAAKHAPSRLS